MAKPLALTSGEPAGIGPDITIKAWQRRQQEALPPFYLLGDADLVRRRARAIGAEIPLAEVCPKDAVAAFADCLPVVPTGHAATAAAGQPDNSSAEAALASIRNAVADVASGKAGAVVTNPIAKAVLYRAGFRHPGHTEFLAELAAEHGRMPQPVMLLWSPTLAVVPVTIHVPLSQAISQLSTELIVATCRITVSDLRRRFGIARPRLALTGLNPHAGEDGTIGSEERTIIAPAIDLLRNEGIDVRGPLPADTLFHDAARRTAFDIAGTGRANPASLIAALRLAARMAAAPAPLETR
jgi:4-hydroxythreonine-4-phosphate dehydrogenase